MKRLLVLLTICALAPTLQARHHHDHALVATAAGVIVGAVGAAAVSSLSNAHIAWTPLMIGLVDAAQLPSAQMVCGLRVNLFVGGGCQALYGIETAGLYNDDILLYGIQTAGIYNYAAAGGGMQVAGMNNANKLAGVQIGAVNVCDNFSGTQIGAVNYAAGGDSLQIGVVNINRFGRGVQVGLVNLYLDGAVPFMPVFNARF